MAMVGVDLANAIRSAMGFPLPLSSQLLGWGNAIVSHVTSTSLISFAPGQVTGIAPASGGPLSSGAASGGLLVGPTGAVLAPLVRTDAGYPNVSPQLLNMCTAICSHIVTNSRIAFSTGNVTGACTNTLITPGVFTGTGSNGTLSGLLGNQLADEVHAAVGFPGSTSTQLKAFCNALVNYIMSNAVASGGIMTGVAPAAGGSITAGNGTGGTLA